MATNVWEHILSKLWKISNTLNESLATDNQLHAFLDSLDSNKAVLFGWTACGVQEGILCSVQHGQASVRIGKVTEADFILTARADQWQQFYKDIPKPPFQSYWGMYGQNIHQEGVEVLGNHDLFLNLAAVWRRVLELSHDALCGPIPEEQIPAPSETDHITGKYTYLNLATWGATKLFYEQSGDVSNPSIVFLHTAGSDGRQYHGVMNDETMLKRYHMTVFDMPGHGRSFPGELQTPGRHSNNEDAYVGVIAAVIKKLCLEKPVVCGASMAGHVSLAVALRVDEVGAGAVIPCQACEFTDMSRNNWAKSAFINQALFSPEYVYGMMAPLSPQRNKNLLWHIYSSQAFSMYHGDLDFYYGGWDGRGRVECIDTKKCPVYMLTGDYDWSTTPEMSEATAMKIPGAKFQRMENLGHFPATENPTRFAQYLVQAMDYVIGQMKANSCS
ncbi:alpha/beta-hydrolase [Aaosphaeria arxii CBS 175.79]|uniref:Alpha/beta-hydrolase n=1 Tax=Aaosphaeria arxii CBS 175.79 TaxID=1450172 RepID=A0A6A5X938_9PLEO|nr:alpha/beta-hydrolase [Aaosphaeria arxii CBS 175.79]KAF2009419.1 alpha/beta-hydrolase [Aaosphaeria arxii CBS 175.79]